jgi:hypothetical protein
MSWETLPAEYRQEIARIRLDIENLLAPVCDVMDDLIEIVRLKNEHEGAMDQWDKISLRILPTEKAKTALRTRAVFVACVKRAYLNDTPKHITRISELSMRIAGILKNMLWNIKMPPSEWLAISLLAHRFEEHGEITGSIVFDPLAWTDELKITSYKLNVMGLPYFDAKSFSETCGYLEAALPDDAAACLIEAVADALRFNKGPLDAWVAYGIFKTLYEDQSCPIPCDGIEHDIATAALEKLRQKKTG